MTGLLAWLLARLLGWLDREDLGHHWDGVDEVRHLHAVQPTPGGLDGAA